MKYNEEILFIVLFLHKVVQLFRKFGLLTILAVIGLIFVGGFVRASGAGMGCPDWPKCFGMWIPPTSIDQLPVDYQTIFGAKLKGEVEFNVVKTWIEYINRLLGVLVGFFIFLTLIFSYRAYFNSNRSVFHLSFAAFVLVLFEGWLGAKVVSSELLPGLITVHMIVAVLILGILVFAILKTYFLEGFIKELDNTRDIRFLIFIVLLLSIGQLIFGTQIREGIDLAQKSLGYNNRHLWIDSVIGKVNFHALLGLIILVLQFLINSKIKGRFEGMMISSFSTKTLIFIVLSIFTGTILRFFGFPAFAQPLHLTLGVVVLTFQFVLLFLTKPQIAQYGK
ncbi:heme A synthase [Lacihabitans sp. CCS-44]|uniref:COX15/CtaA family protein n=1 Tax=Lacihabitans sp. CCS-44 TaxID=2487331 RepID=UPI0020CBBA53|nr:COX15/CtaA family protein [Lacihabitans sp. CCS-44]MCP9755771.1 heme A synthase [Lacihabitans sp. CCS-44]